MRLNRKIGFFCTILVISILLGIYKGSVNLSILELFSKENYPILQIRIVRVLLGILAGSGLGVSGVVLQAILRNPLAEPYLLGISSGAGLGAILGIIFGLSGYHLPLIAFLGALLSIILVYNLARQDNKIPVQSLILSGVIITIVTSAIIVFLISISTNEALHGITWWLLGNLGIFDFKYLLITLIIVVLGILLIYTLSQDLNAISLGEEEAIHLGIEIETIKKVLFIVTSLITASIVSVCGMIGFVGLIIPHMMRLIVGPNHRFLIPSTAIGAAAFLVFCDTVSRSILSPIEIPIGVITALIGAPVFIILFKKGQKIK